MSSSLNTSRRNLFRRRKSDAIRPPWSRQDIEFTDICTRCNKCVSACETQVIFNGDGGFPELSFKEQECTFCQQCVQACPEEIFTSTALPPWHYIASIQDSCLVNQGICCQSCKDACDTGAIKFTPSIGKPPQPVINQDACTACGACLAPCPSDAISISLPKN